jgi:tetratricopeptide (TPR) repeat protein
VNQAMDHLTSAQIEDYVAKGHIKMAGGVFQSLEAHLEDCESCLGRVLHAHRTHLGLLEGDRMNKTRHPGCPEETVLQELAAGISPPETAEATAQHASRCDFCGPLLNRYLKEFSDDLEAEDAALLKQLESSKPSWQKKFVRQYVGSGQDKGERSFFGRFWPALATATAAIAVAATIVVPTLVSSDLNKVDKLVADAYAYGDKRPIETRLTSVPYAPYDERTVERSGDINPDWTSDTPLLQAKGILNQKLLAGELPPAWLDVEGRIRLLQGNAEGAAQDFEKAIAKDASNPRLKVDLAISYFERDVHTDDPNLLRTIDLLTNVLKDPKLAREDRAVALFNLALAHEKSEMWNFAIPEWQEYVHDYPGGPWAVEAQKHLDDAKKKSSSSR